MQIPVCQSCPFVVVPLIQVLAEGQTLPGLINILAMAFDEIEWHIKGIFNKIIKARLRLK